MLRRIGDRPSVASKLIAFLREFFRKHFDRIWKERYAFRVHLDLIEPFPSHEILWNNLIFQPVVWWWLQIEVWQCTHSMHDPESWWNHFSTSKNLIKSTETKTSLLQFAGKIAWTRRVLVRKFSHNFLFWFVNFLETFSIVLKLKKNDQYLFKNQVCFVKNRKVYFHFRSIPESFSKSINSKWNKFCNHFLEGEEFTKKTIQDFHFFLQIKHWQLGSWMSGEILWETVENFGHC